MNDSVERDYFTVQQLSEYSQIGQRIIYAAIKERELTHFRVGPKKLIISKTDFESWFNSKTKQPVVTDRKASTAVKKPMFSFD